MRFHLKKLAHFCSNGVVPKLSLSLLDNCVGQNKSQTVMKFSFFLSLFFYKTVALFYFLSGHTYMQPDRVVGHCKFAIKGLNLYTLGQITEHRDFVIGIIAE